MRPSKQNTVFYISQLYPLRYDILAKFANCAFMLQELHSRNASRSWWKLFDCMWRHVSSQSQVAGVSGAKELPWTYHEHFNMFVRFHHWICKRTKPYSSLKDENWLLGVQDPSRWNIMTHMSPMPGNILPHPSPYPSCTGMTWRFNSAVSHP